MTLFTIGAKNNVISAIFIDFQGQNYDFQAIFQVKNYVAIYIMKIRGLVEHFDKEIVFNVLKLACDLHF